MNVGPVFSVPIARQPNRLQLIWQAESLPREAQKPGILRMPGF